MCFLLEHGGTRVMAANKKSAKTTTMATGVNIKTFAIVRSASVL